MTETRDSGRARRTRRLPMAIGLGLAVLAAGWVAIWYSGRTRVLAEIDRIVADLGRRGLDLRCPDPVIGGFPFRMELTCPTPGVTDRRSGGVASATTVRLVGQVWDPFLLIAEIDGPILVEDGHGGRIAATVRSLRLSLRWSTAGVERLSLTAEGPDLAFTGPGRLPLALKAASFEAHGRQTGTDGRDLDLAFHSAATEVAVAGRRLGPLRSDLDGAATFLGAIDRGAADPIAAFVGRSGRIEPLRLGVAVGGVSLEVSGALAFRPDGRLDGKLPAVVRGIESFAAAKGDLGPELSTAVGGFVLLGQPSGEGRPGRRLDLVVDGGELRLGRLMVGRIPPLAVGP
jgi:hypothetical protein